MLFVFAIHLFNVEKTLKNFVYKGKSNLQFIFKSILNIKIEKTQIQRDIHRQETSFKS